MIIPVCILAQGRTERQTSNRTAIAIATYCSVNVVAELNDLVKDIQIDLMDEGEVRKVLIKPRRYTGVIEGRPHRRTRKRLKLG